MMRLIIAGGRQFDNFDLLSDAVDLFISKNKPDGRPIEIVCGCAVGADLLGLEYANKNGISIKKFPASWDKHGKMAGYMRNAEMATYANALIAFWDGKSPGTEHMIKEARRRSLLVEVIEY